MKRKEFNYLKKNIRSLLRDLDNGFVPDHVYDDDSKMCRTADDLCCCVAFLRDFLKN
uniref:hypothetical protein n=1 Tax=Segatella copri TaxID=165179 RepID=UPI004028B077